MFIFIQNKSNNPLSLGIKRLLALVLVFSLSLCPLPSYAQSTSLLNLPSPGSMVSVSAPFNPPIVKGISIYPDNPLKFDFVIDPGDDKLQGEALKNEANKLIKYFMAALTVPEDEMWVNLSPYEKDRIIAHGLGQTELGRDLLAQDYILKQLTASLMYPEDELGSEFWRRVHAKAQEKYGTTEVPMNTFNKVWIVPEKANVYVNENNVFVVDNYLKVMLEEDYVALENNAGRNNHGVGEIPEDQAKEISEVSKEVIREIIIPEIEREVNRGKNFANLRQIFNSMILATWYKQNLKASLLGQSYANQNKTDGIDLNDPQMKERIYGRYTQAFERGVYSYIKEDYDAQTQKIIPRKYFSGGIKGTKSVNRSAVLAGGENEILDGDESRAIAELQVASSSIKKKQGPSVNGKKKKLYNGVIGLIGVGKQGQRHLRHLVEQDVEVVAVDGMMSEAVFEQYGDNRLVTLKKEESDIIFNDPNIKAVVISTPGKTHYELVKRALTAGKHVLVEKPFTRNTDEAKELVAMAAERNLTLMIGHNRSYLPHFQRLKEIIKSGKLGKILSVEGNYLNTQQIFDTTHTALEGLGYHQFYMIHDLLGQDSPDELLSGVVSEDWETVGLKLRYGDVPVTVKLSRGYDGVKERNIIVRGDNYTATFDYTKEPAETELSFEPTSRIHIEKIVQSNPEILEELQEDSFLSEEDARPSLHHQLKAFREVLYSRETPPSSGRFAVSVVETLEQIRHNLTKSNIYAPNSFIAYSDLVDMVEAIHAKVGKNGGIVAIDGGAGTGKSTLTRLLKDVYELKYPSKRVADLPLDELVRPWAERAVLKKIVLGDALTAEEQDTAQKNGWMEIESAELYESEKIIWNNQIIESTLKEIRELFDSPAKGNHFAFLNRTANIKENGRRIFGVTKRTFYQGDVVFMDGKFANDEVFSEFTDFRVRLKSPPKQIRKRFKEERESLVSPDGVFTQEDLDEHMRYYDLFCWPSWSAYERRTRHVIDVIIEIDMESASSPIEDNEMINGGIDLNPALLNLITSGHGIKYDVPVHLERYNDLPINGLKPVIIQMVPVINVNLLLGIKGNDHILESAQNKTEPRHLNFIEQYRNKFLREDQAEDVSQLSLVSD